MGTEASQPFLHSAVTSAAESDRSRCSRLPVDVFRVQGLDPTPSHQLYNQELVTMAQHHRTGFWYGDHIAPFY